VAYGKPKEVFMYQTSEGKFVQVRSRAKVPLKYRDAARCFDEKPSPYLAKPDEINLKGTSRKVDMASSVGRIELRWPRKIETLFGRTPERAVADAGRTVSRVLKQSGFPLALRTIDLDWKIVFMDEELPEKQIPTMLVNRCHPAWMTPPANIYVVAQRVVAGCGGAKPPGSRVADSQLAQVLLHEMGHVLEYHLLQGQVLRNRMRAEGFASWFEQYSSDYSSVIKKGTVKDYYLKLAKSSVGQSPNTFYFGGTASDYARASLYFHAVVERKRVKGLMDVYQTMVDEKIDYFSAVKKKFYWSDKKFGEEVLRVVK